MEGWSLAKLLELRRREEEERQAALAEARAATEKARAGAAAANERLVDARVATADAARRAAARGAAGATAGELATAERFRARLLAAETRQLQVVRAAETRVREAERVEDAARAGLVEAIKLRELLEKKEAEWHREARRTAERRREDR